MVAFFKVMKQNTVGKVGNYKIMPPTLANKLIHLQGSAVADLRYGGRF